MRCQCDVRSNRAGGMREMNVTSLSEMQVMEDEDHAGYSHANGGENMGRERFDVEAWSKLCEYGIYSLILCYKVVRLRREGEILGIDVLGIPQKAVRVLEN